MFSEARTSTKVNLYWSDYYDGDRQAKISREVACYLAKVFGKKLTDRFALNDANKLNSLGFKGGNVWIEKTEDFETDIVSYYLCYDGISSPPDMIDFVNLTSTKTAPSPDWRPTETIPDDYYS